MKALLRWLLLMGLTCGAMASSADEERAYNEGSVLWVTYVKTEPGKFDEYLKYLDGPYKKLMEENKKVGTIVDYGIYQAYPRSQDEPDMILTIVFKNWGALDGLRDKLDPVIKKVFGSMDASNQGHIERGRLRKDIGSQFLQELKLK
jgi:hypothetical protein